MRLPGGQTAVTLVLDDNTMGADSMEGMILRAGDLETAAAELADRGAVMTEEIRETPRARYSSFQDPDGNFWVIQVRAR